MGSLWEGGALHGIMKMFPGSKCSLASLPYQQQNNCIATYICHFLAHYCLSRENSPTASYLLCKFCQTGVESVCRAEERHMLAIPSTCCSPRGLLERCLLASEELALLSPPPFPLTKNTRWQLASMCASSQLAKYSLDPVTCFMNIREDFPTCVLRSQEYTEFTVRAE